ncbi:MAG: TIGR01777 family oxidoreductase [Bacteroidota bacterium]
MAENKHIVVTGATGLIGRKIIKRLSERGDRVTALVRDVERGRRAAPGATDYLAWSSSMADGPWATAIDGADAVIHLAGSPVATRWSDEQKKRIRDSRVDGTRNVVAAIARASRKPAALVSASAVGYYGTSNDRVFTEEAGPGKDFLADVCRAWEAEALEAEKLGVRVVRMRTGIVLDPEDGALAKMAPTFRLFVGGPIASGRQWFPWIHITDEVEMFLWALDNTTITGAINGTAPGIVRNREFSSALGSALHRPSLFPVPGFALHLIFGDGAMILTEGQHAIPERTEKLGYRFRFPKLPEALHDLLGS